MNGVGSKEVATIKELHMLLLTRKEGESIVIGDGIKVTINRIEGNRVRLAIVAPKEVTVDREEISIKRKASGG